MQEQVSVTATRVNLELLGAAAAGLVLIAVPLVLLVHAMRRPHRRERLANAPLTGLIVLCAISIGAWLWVTLTNVELSARINGPLETFLLALAAIAQGPVAPLSFDGLEAYRSVWRRALRATA